MVPPGWTSRTSGISSRIWATICTRSGIACPLGDLVPATGAGRGILKEHGEGTRLLGVPTVADRIARTVAVLTLEPDLESIVHGGSYGSRPKRSQRMALERCRQQCWRKDWVLDLDVARFFDTVDHDLMVKAIEANTDQTWVVLSVKRWLKAPILMPDGKLVDRDQGTPQGGLCSAEHKPPYEQCWIMRSVGLLCLVRAAFGIERCA